MTWRSRRLSLAAREAVMVLVAAIFALPVYVLVSVSLKDTRASLIQPLGLPSPVEFSNYSTAWSTGGQSGLGHAMLSSVIITSSSLVCLVIIGSLCAYTLARRPSRFSSTWQAVIALALVLPLQLAVIPLFAGLRALGINGTYVGMALLYTGLLMPFTVFLYTGFIRGMPVEYEEAARVDGASLLRIYARVVFPLLRPVSGTVAILAGILIWNDFFTQLIFLSGGSNETLPVALYTFVGANSTAWNLVMAAVVISMAPVLILYLLAQRHVIRGFAGGIRG
jgi:raffinose/stachyose/melibiose transport system permease protein